MADKVYVAISMSVPLYEITKLAWDKLGVYESEFMKKHLHINSE